MNVSLEPTRNAFRVVIRQFARLLNWVSGGRITPNEVTIFGLLAHAPIAVLIATEHNLWAAILLVVFGLFDTLDGELARLRDQRTDAGGFLDASTDRMKEVFLYTGAAYALALSAHPAAAAWAVAACGASLTVSYVKAKGEAVVAAAGRKLPYVQLNKLFASGLLPFEVRMALLVAGLLLGQLLIAVVIIAVFAGFTAFQRLIRISKQLS